MNRRRVAAAAMVITGVLVVAACVGRDTRPTIAAVPQLDLPRFMGDWYVIAHIPTRPEREAFDAVETYTLADDGRIDTTFRFRKGSHDAPIETMTPVATVRPGTGDAVWGMQFVWPIKAEYVVSWVDAGYTQTIIGRSKRDHVWLMARTPQLSDADYAAAMQRIAALGYDVSELRRVPHAQR